MRASEMGNADVVDILLKRGVAVDTLDSSGVTALIQASERGNTDVVNCLLRSGAVVDLVDEQGNTALISAARKGHYSIVERGANIGKQRLTGDTALLLQVK
ncbi:hypothetical protein JG688_00013530 [Phytophthora aleatoria]|uniref:Ankyrin repeat protein n=1 Tax=Phytophthora aleatoria TaxID=2496075 RepID=A0A8J5LYG8_9STRA|nr:hypothetical protein JG688_00013530 [Phytophthora aleatoria]